MVVNQIKENVYIPTYVDSAYSEHLVRDLNLLTDVINIQSKRKSMMAAGGTVVPLTHKGIRIMETEGGPLILNEVYYAQSAEYNLISIPKLTEKGVVAIFMNDGAHIKKGKSKFTLRNKTDYGQY